MTTAPTDDTIVLVGTDELGDVLVGRAGIIICRVPRSVEQRWPGTARRLCDNAVGMASGRAWSAPWELTRELVDEALAANAADVHRDDQSTIRKRWERVRDVIVGADLERELAAVPRSAEILPQEVPGLRRARLELRDAMAETRVYSYRWEILLEACCRLGAMIHRSVAAAEEERVVQAAVRCDDGTIFAVDPPGRHGEALQRRYEAGQPDPGPEGQGFVTNRGRFVDRREAYRIALRADQIIAAGDFQPELYSEDLW